MLCCHGIRECVVSVPGTVLTHSSYWLANVVAMKKTSWFAAPLLLLGSSCAMFGLGEQRTELLATGRVTVTAHVWRAPGAWSLRDVVGEVVDGSRIPLMELTVTVFADLDGNGQLGPNEQRGTWTARSSDGTSRLAASGKLKLGNLSEQEDASLRLDVRAVFAVASAVAGAPSEDHAVVPFQL